MENQYQNNALSSDQIDTNYQTKSIENKVDVKDSYNQNNNQIIEDADSLGINTYGNTVINNVNQESAKKLLEQNKNLINNENTTIGNSNDQFKQRIDQKLNLHERGLLRRSVVNAGKRLVNADDKQ